MQCQLLVLWILVVVVGQGAHSFRKLQQHSKRTMLKPLVHALVPEERCRTAFRESADLFRHGPSERALFDGQPATSSTVTGWSTSSFKTISSRNPASSSRPPTSENNSHHIGLCHSVLERRVVGRRGSVGVPLTLGAPEMRGGTGL